MNTTDFFSFCSIRRALSAGEKVMHSIALPKGVIPAKAGIQKT